jgi:hypothetical protein
MTLVFGIKGVQGGRDLRRYAGSNNLCTVVGMKPVYVDVRVRDGCKEFRILVDDELYLDWANQSHASARLNELRVRFERCEVRVYAITPRPVTREHHETETILEQLRSDPTPETRRYVYERRDLGLFGLVSVINVYSGDEWIGFL